MFYMLNTKKAGLLIVKIQDCFAKITMFFSVQKLVFYFLLPICV